MMSTSKETKEAIAAFWANIAQRSATGSHRLKRPSLSQGLKDSLIMIALGVGTGIMFGLVLAYVLFFGGSMYGN
jgi:hypothetical protein